MRKPERGEDGLVMIVDRDFRITIIYGLARSEMDTLCHPRNRCLIPKLIEKAVMAFKKDRDHVSGTRSKG